MNAIDNTNKHFKGQLPTEEVEAFCRKHWSVLMKDIVGFFLFLGILALTVSQLKGVYKYFVQESTLRALLALSIVGIFTIYIHKFFIKIISYFLHIIIITNYRIIILDKSLYLENAQDAIDIAKIQDIHKVQSGVFDNLLGVGKLVITLSSSSSIKIITAMPNPDYHFRKINKIKRSYMRKRNPINPSYQNQMEENVLEQANENILEVENLS
jgi:hypothetical protein